MSIEFDLPKNKSNIIKVVGIGGGGSNAVNHMYEQNIKGVDYVICNTDAQALESSKVPNKIQLGSALTEGLGAGSNPEIGKKAAEESLDQLKAMLETQTKMVFITAGMGGGTGTGAAPVVAKIAKDLGILTVGIVTIPFSYEGKRRGEQAMQGVEKLRENVDSLIVINNNKLSEIYGDLGFKQGYAKVDEVLTTAAKGIAEVISKHYLQNIDLEDARTVLAGGGTAIMGAALASGEGRAKKAVEGALNSPLLNDNRIVGARNVLLLIVFGNEEITQGEVKEINEYIQSEAGNSAEIIMGIGEDTQLEDQISVTVIATGFNPDMQNKIVNAPAQKVVYNLDQEQSVTRDLTQTQYPTIDLDDSFSDEIDNTIQNEVASRESVEAISTEIFSIEVNCSSVTDEQSHQAPSLELADHQQTQTHMYTSSGITRFTNVQPIAPKSYQPQLSLDFSEIENATLSVANQSEGKKVYTLMSNPESVDRSEPVRQKATEFKTKVNMEDSVKESLNWDIRNESNTADSVMEELKQNLSQRKKTLKDMSYRFSNELQSIEIPAYIRQGVELTSVPEHKSPSRETLITDTNGEIQIRKNNSYLHDNVD